MVASPTQRRARRAAVGHAKKAGRDVPFHAAHLCSRDSLKRAGPLEFILDAVMLQWRQNSASLSSRIRSLYLYQSINRFSFSPCL